MQKGYAEISRKSELSEDIHCELVQKDYWKCNQALIVGFGDNDHAIRGLMRFIKMTSRESTVEDVRQNIGAPIINIDGFKLKEGLNSFIFWI